MSNNHCNKNETNNRVPLYNTNDSTSESTSNVSNTNKDWCDSDNFGVTHFGIDPSQFHIQSVRQDFFHCKCAIIWRMMECTRRIVLIKHSTIIVKLFTEEVLKEMYNYFHIYCWNNGLNFNKFKGHDLSMFVYQIKKVITFFNK